MLLIQIQYTQLNYHTINIVIGTVSFRNTNEGSYYIQTLIKLIKENPSKDISHVIIMLRNNFITGRY